MLENITFFQSIVLMFKGLSTLFSTANDLQTDILDEQIQILPDIVKY